MTLALCPVCGRAEDDDIGIFVEMRFNPEEYSVYCSNCGCSTKHFPSEKEAINAWNKMCDMKKERNNGIS